MEGDEYLWRKNVRTLRTPQDKCGRWYGTESHTLQRVVLNVCRDEENPHFSGLVMQRLQKCLCRKKEDEQSWFRCSFSANLEGLSLRDKGFVPRLICNDERWPTGRPASSLRATKKPNVSTLQGFGTAGQTMGAFKKVDRLLGEH